MGKYRLSVLIVDVLAFGLLIFLIACISPEVPTRGNCDASYPGVCIPPAPPLLTCNDITHRRFDVLQPDPHGFDRDKNGIGCERG